MSGLLRRGTFLCLSAALLLAAPISALAAEEGAHGPSGWLLGLQVFNTFILLAILVRYTREPLREFMVQRRHQIESTIEEAKSRLDAAETELARWKTRLDAVDEESRQMVRAAEELARDERALALERGEASAQRIREEAQRVARQEIERARTELQLEAAALATRLAGDLVRQGLREDDDRRLVQEAIDRIGDASSSSTSNGSGS